MLTDMVKKVFLKAGYEKKPVARCPTFPPEWETATGPSPVPTSSPRYSSTRVERIDPVCLKKNKIVSLFPEERLTDQMKILHTQVLNRMEEIGGNSLLVAGANPGEGKTWLAINLAISISQKLDQTVLLVDADLRAPSIHRSLGLDCRKGLSDYLLHQAEIPDLLVNPGIQKLVLLPGGTPLPNSVELLGSPRMEALVKEMKERYKDRFLIFDTSPLLTSADGLVLSRFLDGLLLLLESEKSRTKDMVQMLKMLQDRQIIGAVMNKARQ